jgi:hypothetical protein
MTDDRRALVIACPETHQEVPTGAYVTAGEFEAMSESRWAFRFRCPACEDVHEVNGEETRLGDDTFAASKRGDA